MPVTVYHEAWTLDPATPLVMSLFTILIYILMGVPVLFPSMSMDHRLYLDDIIEAARRIKEFTDKMEFSTFQEDLKTQDAVVRNLEVIGEASGRLPESVRKLAPNISMHEIIECPMYSDKEVDR